METIQIKYDNFRKFLTEAVQLGLFWLSLIASVPLDSFLYGIYERAGVDPSTNNKQGIIIGGIAKIRFHCQAY
jgi:hypothetical protein